MNKRCLNIAGSLLENAKNTPDALAYVRINHDLNVGSDYTFDELYREAIAIAGELSQVVSPTETALLIFDDNFDLLPALYACFFSDVVAFPVSVSKADKGRSLQGILQCVQGIDISAAVTTSAIASCFQNDIEQNVCTDILLTDSVKSAGNLHVDLPSVDDQSVALILQSSGEGESKKKIPFTHGQLAQCCDSLQGSYGLSSESRSLNWLPFDHYMGLFNGVLQAMYTGYCGYLLPLESFFSNPLIWLSAVSKYKVTFSGGPGFSYQLCLDAGASLSDGSLDLSSWSCAYTGAEPVKQDTLDRFSSLFSQYQFRQHAFYTSYGMAELPLISVGVYQAESGTGYVNGADNNAVVDSGSPLLDIVIVDGQTGSVCDNGETGQIWIAAEKVQSCLQGGMETQQSSGVSLKDYQGKTYFNTGDVGQLLNGKLRVSGREAARKPDSEHGDSVREVSGKSSSSAHRVSSLPDTVGDKADDIAVIGMGGVFPQSDSCEEFWHNLENGVDLISEIPGDRWDWKEIYGTPDNESHITNIKWGGFINDVAAFDASFFNISPIEAELMDPMQRKLIQVVWHAVEDAGYRMKDYSGKPVGVFVGIGTFDYLQLILENDKFTHAYASTGVVHCMAANRISYLFNFKGPSEAVDTACSSSLVALHRASEAVKGGECDTAIVCGANILLSSSVYVALSNASMLSESGRCKTFDQQADGYVRGEGVGAIVLKKLNASLRDGDNIYGLIKGTAVNHGGHTSSLTAPNPFSQSEVIEQALDRAGIKAETMSYIEAHGTATSLGDPIEITGLINAFTENAGGDPKKYHCALGSVKTNIGHLEAAAGIAGVIKVLKSIRHKKIPAHLHLNNVNQNICIDDSPFYFVEGTHDWQPLRDEKGSAIPRRAGVSSFGFGGVNSHVIMEELPDNTRPDSASDSAQPNAFIFSARSDAVLQRYAKEYSEFVRNIIQNGSSVDFNHFAYTLQVGREAFDARLAIIASSYEELLEKLDAFYQNRDDALKKYTGSLFCGVFNDSLASLVFGENKDDIENLESQLVRASSVAELSQLWIMGADVAWQKLYQGKRTRRISLPTYPFQKDMHWVPLSEKSVNRSRSDNACVNDTYDVTWVESALPEKPAGKNNGAARAFIVLCDKQGSSKPFCDYAQNNGARVYKVFYGDKTGRTDDGDYVVNLYDPASYTSTLKDICASAQEKTVNVMNFWAMDRGPSTAYSAENLAESYMFTCKSALFLIQALVSLQDQVSFYTWFICSKTQPVDNETINLNTSPLWGLSKTLLLEQPDLFRAIIDIDDINTDSAASLWNETVLRDEEGEIVYRDSRRFVTRLEAAKVKKDPAFEIEKDSTYLVTGGLGSLGLLVAKWLSSHGARKVLLLSRRGMDGARDDTQHQENLRIIESMRNAGTEVEVLKGDVTNLEQMKSICDPLIQSGELRNIYHLAGAYKESSVVDMSFDEFRMVVSAKVEGTWVLNEITKNHPLSSLVLFSSGASVWGAATGAHYSAANYFLDSYTHYCDVNALPATSISWGGLWKDSGIIPKNKEVYFKSIGVKETTPEEGLEQLEAILSSGERFKVVAPIEWQLFLDVMNVQRTRTIFELLSTDSSDAADRKKDKGFDEDALRQLPQEERDAFIKTELESLVKGILGIKEDVELPNDKGFFDLGLDSLTSIDLKNKVEKVLGVKLSTTELFDYSTLRLLSECITAVYRDDNDQGEGEQCSDDNQSADEYDDFENLTKDDLLQALKLEMDITSGN